MSLITYPYLSLIQSLRKLVGAIKVSFCVKNKPSTKFDFLEVLDLPFLHYLLYKFSIKKKMEKKIKNRKIKPPKKEPKKA